MWNGKQRARRTRPRAAIVVAIPLALACLFTSAGCGDATHDPAPGAAAASTITLRARVHRGPWQRALSLKLIQTSLTEFSLCAVWNTQTSQRFKCGSGAQLPADTTLRLEQSPAGHGLKRADSPGWGMVASSEEATLEAALSNAVSGNRPGAVHYRVTLRDTSGKVLAHSNFLTVNWHG